MFRFKIERHHQSIVIKNDELDIRYLINKQIDNPRVLLHRDNSTIAISGDPDPFIYVFVPDFRKTFAIGKYDYYINTACDKFVYTENNGEVITIESLSQDNTKRIMNHRRFVVAQFVERDNSIYYITKSYVGIENHYCIHKIHLESASDKLLFSCSLNSRPRDARVINDNIVFDTHDSLVIIDKYDRFASKIENWIYLSLDDPILYTIVNSQHNYSQFDASTNSVARRDMNTQIIKYQQYIVYSEYDNFTIYIQRRVDRYFSILMYSMKTKEFKLNIVGEYPQQFIIDDTSYWPRPMFDNLHVVQVSTRRYINIDSLFRNKLWQIRTKFDDVSFNF